jgi:hypothetical protein
LDEQQGAWVIGQAFASMLSRHWPRETETTPLIRDRDFAGVTDGKHKSGLASDNAVVTILVCSNRFPYFRFVFLYSTFALKFVIFIV